MVLENNERSLVEARTFVKSLREFGGKISDSLVEIHYVNELPSKGDGLESDEKVVKNSPDCGSKNTSFKQTRHVLSCF